jgi:hypothetical protein
VVDFRSTQDSEERFEAYVDALAEAIGHADRRGPLNLLGGCRIKAFRSVQLPEPPDLG